MNATKQVSFMLAQMKAEKNMALLILLGLVLPFGNIWGPLIAAAESLEQKKFRRNLIICQSILAVAAWATGIIMISRSMDALTEEIDTAGMRLGIAISGCILAIGTILLSLFFYLYAIKRQRSSIS